MRWTYFAGGPFVLNISQNYFQPDIRALAVAAGWNGVNELLVNITSTLLGPVDLGTTVFHSGITLNISAATRIGGAPGGPAIKTAVPVNINNLGIISGGGGTGGDGGHAEASAGNVSASASGGSGGQGQGLVLAGGGMCAIQPASGGSAGSYQSATDPVTPPYPSCWAQGGSGADGGAWGQSAVAGGFGTWGGTGGATGNGWGGSAGGAAGAAVNGNSHVTWLAVGTRLGGLTG